MLYNDIISVSNYNRNREPHPAILKPSIWLGFLFLILVLLCVAVNTAFAGENEAYTFLCTQMDKYIQSDIPRLVESYSTPYPPGPYDSRTGRSDLYKIAFTYDNAITAIAFILKGTETPNEFDDYTKRAKSICQAFVWYFDHDPSVIKKLRDAYYADQIPQGSNVLLYPQEYSFSRSSLGNMSWVIIALLRYYATATDSDITTKNIFLSTAKDIAEFIHTNLYDSANVGYLHNIDIYNNIANYKSAEQNLTAYAAFIQLYDITKDEKYKTRALYAKKYVEKACWDDIENKYYSGSDAYNVANTYNLVSDVNALVVLAFDPSSNRRLAINWNKNKLLYTWQGHTGIDFGYNKNYENSPDGIWFEGCSQMALAYQAFEHYGFTNNSQSYIDTLNYAQTNAPNADGKSIVSASKDALTTGFDGFNYYASPHIGTTSWYIMALTHYNPFWGIATDVETPYSNIAYKKPVNCVPPTYQSQPYCLTDSRRYFKENMTDGITKLVWYYDEDETRMRVSLAYPGAFWWDPANSLSPAPYQYKQFDYEIDLQGSYNINKVKMHWGYFGAQVANCPDIPYWHGKPYIDAWRFWYLDSLGTWQPASEYTSVPYETITERDVNITTNKLRITAWGYHWSGIYELEAFGKENILETPQTPTLSINDNAEFTNQKTVNLKITTFQSNIAKMCFSEDGVTYTTPVDFVTDYQYTFINYQDGSKKLYVKLKNNQEVYSEPAQAAIILDATEPINPSIQITERNITNNKTIHLTLHAEDPLSGLDKMQITINGTPLPEETYMSQKTIELSDGDGQKTVSAVYKDKAGNVSQSVSANITLDTTPPTPPTINPPITPTNTNSQTITGTKSVDTTQIIITCSTATVGSVTYPSATTWTCTLTNLSQGTNTIAIKAKDAAGNESALVLSAIALDTIAPTGTIKINNDSQYTNSTAVTLTLSATDALSAVTQMQFSNDNITYSSPENYSITKTWTLTAGDGTKTVYTKFKDFAGNWSNPVQDSIILDTIAPSITNITPVDGSIFEVGDSVSFNIIATDSGILYQIVIDGTTAKDWNTSPIFNWDTTSKPTGTHTATISIKDGAGNESSKQIEIYLVKKSVELPLP